jgi:predicted esterase YcpF (UPF0227 family)
MKHYNTQIIYIHGLGSSASTSKKFQDIHSAFENVIPFHWNQKTLTLESLENFANKLDTSKHIIIIGSSAGGKLAVRLHNILKDKTWSGLVLLNPLFDVDFRKQANQTILTNQLLLDDIEASNITEALVIYSEEDELIDQKLNVESMSTSNKFVKVHDNHRLSNSSSVIVEEVDKYLNSYT